MVWARRSPAITCWPHSERLPKYHLHLLAVQTRLLHVCCLLPGPSHVSARPWTMTPRRQTQTPETRSHWAGLRVVTAAAFSSCVK
jgi:hypothetical protein